LGLRVIAKPGRRTRTVLFPPHSGQRMPTGVETMHSVQIGRPQFAQLTPVSRSPCR
jgi:hypothetical protein